MKNSVMDWIPNERDNGRYFSGNMMKEKSLIFLTNSGFRASNGWLRNFLKREESDLDCDDDDETDSSQSSSDSEENQYIKSFFSKF